jgi:hypothetical protein
MNDKELLDIDGDYLISSFGLTTGTGLSRLRDGAISHDRIKVVNPYVQQVQAEEGVILIDDSISEKPYPDKNAIVCWHYDLLAL